MALKSDLETQVKNILKTQWKAREGTVVPTDQSVTLGNDAVELEATVLYADLADSTELVDNFKPWFAAEVYKCYLYSCAKIISAEGGSITAYDGDRIMAVFIGKSKNTSAVRAALKIHWAVINIIRPAIAAEYPQSKYVISSKCGIDTSKLFVAKTGIRGANDLVWVGRAANYAAKLAALSSKPTWITKAIYDNMADEAKFSNGTDMWVSHTWTQMNNHPIYSSTYSWTIK